MPSRIPGAREPIHQQLAKATGLPPTRLTIATQTPDVRAVPVSRITAPSPIPLFTTCRSITLAHMATTQSKKIGGMQERPKQGELIGRGAKPRRTQLAPTASARPGPTMSHMDLRLHGLLMRMTCTAENEMVAAVVTTHEATMDGDTDKGG